MCSRQKVRVVGPPAGLWGGHAPCAGERGSGVGPGADGEKTPDGSPQKPLQSPLALAGGGEKPLFSEKLERRV